MAEAATAMQHARSPARRRTREASAPPPGKGSGRTPLQIADHNLRVTLEAIRREGPLTRQELAGRSGLTAPGITNILRRLSHDGLIEARQRRKPGSGQPSTEFALNPDGAFAIGLRLHSPRSEAVLLDLSGSVRQSVVFDPRPDLGEAIKEIVGRFRETLPAPDKLIGVGIATETPGAIDVEALNARVSPLRVLVERDAVAAVLAERTLGVGIVDGGLVLVIIDDDVRAGLMLQGVPFGGVHGRAGGIGAMRTGADHVPLVSMLGLAALRALLAPAERERLAARKDIPITPPVEDWIRSAAGHLLDALVATAGFVAPGAILIGGDLPRNIVEALIARISVERGDTAIRPVATPWISPIRPASFEGAGIAVGAALLPFFDLLLPSPIASAATISARERGEPA